MEFDLEHTNGIHIPHLSASTINSFINDRFGFYQSKVMKAPFKGNQYTSRGTAVEHAVNCWIENPSLSDEILIKLCEEKFDEELSKTNVSKFTAEEIRESLPPLVKVALGFYKKEFESIKAETQHKFEYKLDGVTRPIIGYLDFYQPKVKVRDSKVVSKTPSKLSQAYILQGSLYRAAKEVGVCFDFFIPNKTAVHKSIELSDDEFIFGMSYLTRAAQVIEELETCDNPKRVMELMSFPNLDNFYNYEDRKEAAKIWGIRL